MVKHMVFYCVKTLSCVVPILVELLSRYGSVCQRVDGINHEVRLGVVLLLQSIAMAMGPDCFHHHLCSWYLLLDVSLQNAETKNRTRVLKNGGVLFSQCRGPREREEKKHNLWIFPAEEQIIQRST